MKQLKKSIKSKAQGGFTLIEFMIAAALIIAASVVVFNMSQASKVASQVHAESQALSSAAARIKSAFNSRPSYAGLNDAFAIAAKAFPEGMITGTTLTNTWGGGVTLGTVTVNGVNDKGFTVTYASVPKAQCVDLASAMDGGFGKIEVTVGATPAVVKNTLPGVTAVPFDATALAGACDEGSTIVFTSL